MRSIPSEKIFSLLPRWRFNWGWMGIDKSCTKAEKSLQKLSFDCYNKSSLSLTLSLALFLFPGRKKKAQQERRKKLPKPICEHTNCCNWMSRSNFHTQILRKKGAKQKFLPPQHNGPEKYFSRAFFFPLFLPPNFSHRKLFPSAGNFLFCFFFPLRSEFLREKKRRKKSERHQKNCGSLRKRFIDSMRLIVQLISEVELHNTLHCHYQSPFAVHHESAFFLVQLLLWSCGALRTTFIQSPCLNEYDSLRGYVFYSYLYIKERVEGGRRRGQGKTEKSSTQKPA